MNQTLLPFTKYSGNGNDFIILDHPEFPPTKELVQRLCSRHFGVGADGVLTLTSAEGADGEMRIFNADGGEAEMCGNGLRCLVTYMDDEASIRKTSYKVRTMNHDYVVSRQDGAFAVEMSWVKSGHSHDLSVFKDFERSFFVNTGVPHLVFLGSDIKEIDIKKLAPQYRHHPMFAQGVNVNFVEVFKDSFQSVYVRTYERGVEDETYSCGTGLTATALALSEWFKWKGDINLLTMGGKQRVQVGEKVFYSGEVSFCFKGAFKA